VPLKGSGKSLERLVCDYIVDREKLGVDSRRGEAKWKERSVICREDDVEGQASVTKDEEQVL